MAQYKIPFNRKEYMKKYNALYRLANAEKYREYNLKYKQEKKQAIKDQRKDYRLKKANHIKGQVWRNKLGTRYGISPEQWNEMSDLQHGKCAICIKKSRLEVDHNHDTGQVRALLCGNCNRAIGLMFEDIKILKSAIKYIKKYDK